MLIFLWMLMQGKVSFKTFTSWAKDEKVAIRFASDTGASGSKAQGTVRIIIKKKITVAKQDLDIDTFATYMGSKQLITMGMDDLSVDSAMTEKEILCAPGIKLSMKDIYRL